MDLSSTRQFTDETATCMIVSDAVFAMLLIEANFKTFMPNASCETAKATEVLVCGATIARQLTT